MLTPDQRAKDRTQLEKMKRGGEGHHRGGMGLWVTVGMEDRTVAITRVGSRLEDSTNSKCVNSIGL
jgi:hypothetical protein